MSKHGKIRLLIVDDSIVFQEAIKRALAPDKSIEVIATASNPAAAIEQIKRNPPDVITCDVEMPVMDGIEFIRRLLPQYFVPVVMVSSVSKKVFEALEAGAIDFVVKPDVRISSLFETFSQDLIHKIKTAYTVKEPTKLIQQVHTPISAVSKSSNDIIAIGASTGGTEAIFSIISSLPSDIPGCVIVQHIPPVFSKMFAQRLNDHTALRVKEAENGDFLDRGQVLIAPGGLHMTVKQLGGRYRVECFEGEKVNGHCPSVDVLFESVAKTAGDSAVGVLLTGMGYDGAKGLLSIKRKGGRTIGQDQASSVVYGMPKIAFDIGAVQIQSPLDKIPQDIINMLNR